MTTRTDAQLNLYFGDGQRLTHSQSQANLLHSIQSNIKSSSSGSSGSSEQTEINEYDDDDQDEESSIYSETNDNDNVDDIYSVVAWQLGHDPERCGSVSDGAAITEKQKYNNHQKKRFTLTKRKGLKWYKKLFRQKSNQSYYNSQYHHNDNASLGSNVNNKDIDTNQNEKELKHSQSTANLKPYISSEIDIKNEKNPYGSPISIKLQSPTNREIRFELILYEKRNKLRYKLMDHLSNKCICSNIKRFDVKKFLSKHRMSIDHELQLIQTIQHYKQVMLSQPLPSKSSKKINNDKKNKLNENMGDITNNNSDHELLSSSSSTTSDDQSITLDTIDAAYIDEDDEESSAFDLYHVTTPRRKYNSSSPFMQYKDIVDIIHNRYEKHTKQNPYLANYLLLRKKQQQIEEFYREKVADQQTIPLIANNSVSNLNEWKSGKLGLKCLIKSKQPRNKPIKPTVNNNNNRSNNNNNNNSKITKNNQKPINLTANNHLSLNEKSGYSGDESSMISSMDNISDSKDNNKHINIINNQTENEDADDEYQNDDGYVTDDEDEEEDDGGDEEEEEEDDEQSEDDSDASMDSDTLKRILLQAKEMQKKAKRQRKQSRIKSKSKRSKKKSKHRNKDKEDMINDDTNHITYQSLKPPSLSNGDKSKSKLTRKKKGSKRKGLKKRKKTHIPRFMKSKSHTPRKAHKLKTYNLNDATGNNDSEKQRKPEQKKIKRKRSFTSSSPSNLYNKRNSLKTGFKKRFFSNDNFDENNGNDTYATSQSDIGGTLHSPQYLRVKSKNSLTKAIPVKMLGFGGTEQQ